MFNLVLNFKWEVVIMDKKACVLYDISTVENVTDAI